MAINNNDWWYVTALGDSAVLLPCALLIALWLLVWRETRKTGWLWLLAVLVDAGGVALTKVLYMGWGLHPPGLDFIGLSGHSALSFLIWPVVGALAAARARPGWRALGIAAGALLALGVTVSRLVLHAHSPSEALLGGVCGALLAGTFLGLSRWPLAVPAAGRWIALSLLLPLFVTYGQVFPSNRVLAWVALRLSGHAAIYTRRDLGRRAGTSLPQVLPRLEH